MLPPELVHHVCSFLAGNTPALAAVARVSPSWSAVALRVLYRHVSLSSPHPGPLATLAHNQPLAAVVRSFAISLSSWGHSQLAALVATALANMSQLVQLDVFVPPSCPLFRNTTHYPFLTRFATSLPWSPDLVHFLHKSPTITQLYLDSPSPPDFPLPSGFLPSLSHFTGPPSLALLLVPHRPVQHIDLTSFPRLTSQLALSLSQSSAPVLALAASTSSTGPADDDEDLVSVLRVLAACMRHLKHLRVVTNTYADTFGGPVFDDVRPPLLPHSDHSSFLQSYFENITDALTSLPDLQSCEIWGFHWVSSKNHKMYSPTSNWHPPSFNSIPSTTNNFLDDLYQDLMFPY
jgi:hypothetical protein